MQYFPWDKRGKALLGLAFDSVSVQIVGLSQRQPQQYRIEAFGSASIAPNILVGQDIKDPEALARSIRLAHQHSGSRIKQIAVAIPNAQTIYHYVDLPKMMTDDILFAHILLETSKLVPYALTEVAMDYRLLPCSEANQFQQALLVCSRQNYIDILTNVIRLAGLIPVIVDTEAFVLTRACERLLPLLGLAAQQCMSIIHMSHYALHFIAFHEHRVVFTREETMVMESTPTSLIAFINRSLQFFETVQRPKAIEHILLCGLRTEQEPVTQYIQQATGMTTTLINPLLGMLWPSELTPIETNDQTATLTLACGLAMRSSDDTVH